MSKLRQEIAREFDLAVLDNLGVDFTFTLDIHDQNSQKNEAWSVFADFMCMSKSCTGFANHAVMVCRKQ